MSKCTKGLMDYDLIKRCSKCGIISLKNIFHKNNLTKDGLFSQCKSCVIQKQKQYQIENRVKKRKYYNENQDKIEKHRSDNKDKRNGYCKNRKEKDLNFKIACNLQSRTSMAFKSQNVRKTNKTFDLLGCSHWFFKVCIVHHKFGNMTLENSGSVWQIEYCLAVAYFNLLDEKELRECFN